MRQTHFARHWKDVVVSFLKLGFTALRDRSAGGDRDRTTALANRNGQTHDRRVGAEGLAESPIIAPGSEGGAFRKSRAHDLSGDSVIARPPYFTTPVPV